MACEMQVAAQPGPGGPALQGNVRIPGAVCVTRRCLPGGMSLRDDPSPEGATPAGRGRCAGLTCPRRAAARRPRSGWPRRAAQDVSHVFDRVGRHHQVTGDALVRLARGEQPRHLQLAVGQTRAPSSGGASCSIESSSLLVTAAALPVCRAFPPRSTTVGPPGLAHLVTFAWSVGSQDSGDGSPCPGSGWEEGQRGDNDNGADDHSGHPGDRQVGIGRATAGSLTRARAMATRWRCPPESAEGRWPARSPNPTWSRSWRARRRACRCSTHASSMPVMMDPSIQWLCLW
jgi:hypothetical protein